MFYYLFHYLLGEGVPGSRLMEYVTVRSGAAFVLAMLIAKWTGLDIDGWVGLVVAGFILFSGVNSARETISPLLGQPPEKEFVDRIQAIVLSHPEILGLHDLVVHDYGPGRVMVSLHA